MVYDFLSTSVFKTALCKMIVEWEFDGMKDMQLYHHTRIKFRINLADVCCAWSVRLLTNRTQGMRHVIPNTFSITRNSAI